MSINNDFYDKNYINKININRTFLNSINIPKRITIKQAKNEFDNCTLKKYVLKGNKFDKTRQKHVKYVNKVELYKRLIKY